MFGLQVPSLFQRMGTARASLASNDHPGTGSPAILATLRGTGYEDGLVSVA